MIEDLRERILNLPEQCGVYIMKDAQNKPIYVGKAVSLKNRVMQYLPPASDNRFFIEKLGREVEDIEVLITSNEREALLLENELIKKFKPKYNIRLKDDKNFVSIRIDKGSEFPKLEIVRRQKKDGALYFGPYIRSIDIRQLVKLLRITFKIRTCKDTEFRQRKRPCIQYQINRCLAPCVYKDEEIKRRYEDSIKRCIQIISGKDREILSELEEEMERLSSELRFEEAAQIRDILSIINRRAESQSVININAPDMDIIGLKRQENYISLFVLKFRDGRVQAEMSFVFEDLFQDENEVFEEVFPKLYLHSDDIPEEIVLPSGVKVSEDLRSIISSDKKVEIREAKSGFKANLMGLAVKNAEYRLVDFLNKNSVLHRIKYKFSLTDVPHRIECYDISHISGSYTVGSKVVMVNGQLSKDDYRRYRIESTSGGDDYSAIYEVMSRRLSHTEEIYPDLILIDGGLGQLNAAAKAISEKGLLGKIELLAIAKERGDKYNRVYRMGSKSYIKLDETSEESKFLILMRDEAHRFANDYRERLYRKENI